MALEIFNRIGDLIKEINSASVVSIEELEKFRIKFIGSKNILKPLSKEFKNIPNENKKEFGVRLNELKTVAESKFNMLKLDLEKSDDDIGKLDIDLSRPGEEINLGSRHPVSLVMNRIVEIFSRIGFVTYDNREIEDEWHNFTALNTPENHPARDMQDTYYLLNDMTRMLRSQTSSAQVHIMESQKPPIRVISPGRVYRNETISARAHAQFHQVEGLYIDKNVSFADLKQTLTYFAKEMYGENAKIRLRPSYFPFTEPSAEMDVSCFICDSKGCNVCKYTGWVEILGCGMVDPNVLKNCGIDTEEYTGFAFGMGIERIAMLKYKINDIRLLFENDARFIKQFASEL